MYCDETSELDPWSQFTKVNRLSWITSEKKNEAANQKKLTQKKIRGGKEGCKVSEQTLQYSNTRAF